MNPNLLDLRFLMKIGNLTHSDAYRLLSIHNNLEEAVEALGLNTKSILTNSGFKKNRLVTYSIEGSHRRYGKIVAVSSLKKPLYVSVKHFSSNYKLPPYSLVVEFEGVRELPKAIDYLNKPVYIGLPMVGDETFPLRPSTREEKKIYNSIKKERMKQWIKEEFQH